MIRDATPGDIPRLVEMGEGFFAASSHATYSTFDRASVAAALHRFIAHDDVVLVVLETEGVVVGMACVVVLPAWYNAREVVGTELFFWIEPEHRSPGMAGDILARLERWVEDRGAVGLNMGANECQRPDVLTRWYARAGYAPSERLFVKGLNT